MCYNWACGTSVIHINITSQLTFTLKIDYNSF